MSKNVEPLILERNQKLINSSKQQRIAQNEIINKENAPIISKAILKKNSERLSEKKNKQSSKKNIAKNNPFQKDINGSHKNENLSPKEPQIIEINDIIGEKCDLDLDILQLQFNNFDHSKTSSKPMGIIKGYGANTYQGLVRNYNEDRVSIIINMNKPKNYNKKIWPKTSFFGIYDGHGGNKCADYLRDSLHKLIFSDENYPENVNEAIKNGFLKAENEFLNNHSLDKNNNMNIIDRSGSCAIIVIIIENKIYVANVGDSRGLLSKNNGNEYIIITEDHKPSNENEQKRITENGGEVYQTQTPINGVDNDTLSNQILLGPYRVLPGRLSVSRTIGDVEAKKVQFGGNPKVIIPNPDIYCYDLNKDDIDFIILGCDGIYDQISSNEILDLAWMIFNNKEINNNSTIHDKCGLIVDFILKASMARKSFDNVTCVIIALKEYKSKNNLKEEVKNNFINEINIIQNNNDQDSIKEPKKIFNEVNKEFKMIPPSFPKSSYNTLSHIHPKTNITNYIDELKKRKTKGITLNAESSKKRNIQKITIDNNKKNKNINSKKKLTNPNKTEMWGMQNIKKLLNKSDVAHQENKKLDSERMHSKKMFVKKIPKFNITNSQNNLEYSHSPIEQRRSDLNMLKIHKISNRIHSSNHLINKRAQFNHQNINKNKNTNSEINLISNSTSNMNKKRFITMNNLNSISNLHEKKKKIGNKSDLSCDILNKNQLKGKKNKLSELKKNKNRNEIKMKLQNNSGINSFRNYMNKNEINSKSANKNKINGSERMRGSNSSNRKNTYHQILNNLNFHFQIQKQKAKKSYPMKKRFIQKQRLTEKKLSHSKDEKTEMFFIKNLNYFDYQNNKKLKLDVNYSNSNNYNNTRMKGGMKYMNSVENNIVLDLNSENNNKLNNKFHKIINNKKISIQKYSSSSLKDNKINRKIIN